MCGKENMSKLPLEYNMVYMGCEHWSHKKEWGLKRKGFTELVYYYGRCKNV